LVRHGIPWDTQFRILIFFLFFSTNKKNKKKIKILNWASQGIRSKTHSSRDCFRIFYHHLFSLVFNTQKKTEHIYTEEEEEEEEHKEQRKEYVDELL